MCNGKAENKYKSLKSLSLHLCISHDTEWLTVLLVAVLIPKFKMERIIHKLPTPDVYYINFVLSSVISTTDHLIDVTDTTQCHVLAQLSLSLSLFNQLNSTFAHMNPFSLSLLSRCSLTMGPSFWKKGCLSGLAMVPAPLVLAYWSHSLDALSDTGVK